MSDRKIQFRMNSFWKVFLKARLLQFFAATKYPQEEGNKYFARAQGMIEAMRCVFGKEFCQEIEKAITVEFAMKMDKENSPDKFEFESDEDKRKLADLSVVVIEKLKGDAQNFERVKMAMLSKGLMRVAEILGDLAEEKKPSGDGGTGRGITITMPPKDDDDKVTH